MACTLTGHHLLIMNSTSTTMTTTTIINFIMVMLAAQLDCGVLSLINVFSLTEVPFQWPFIVASQGTPVQ